ncbi:cytochrome c biogenesis protein CcdA [Hyphomicrobium sp.]|uniref:cytochrome c biogenesis protein CcdA n=1 Tax=Hyphomicrobium sp. TaxID=82 RepID=UPI0025C495E9|nr:cytochrome c biogenesis protein CcdA [Hyphomicrobium sp.]
MRRQRVRSAAQRLQRRSLRTRHCRRHGGPGPCHLPGGTHYGAGKRWALPSGAGAAADGGASIGLGAPALGAAEGARLRAGGAFGTGFLLSPVLGPCGTPILAAVLSYAAYQGQMLYGALLLFL